MQTTLQAASLASITAIFLIAVILKWQRRLKHQNSSSIPLVKYRIPWIGSSLDYRRSPATFFRTCRQTYGPVFRVYVGGRYLTVVSSPVGIDNVLWRPQNLDIFEFQLTHRIAGIADRRKVHIHQVTKPVMDLATRELAKRHVAIPSLTFSLHFLDRLRSLSESDSNHRVHQLSEFVQMNMYHSISFTMWGPLLPTDANTIQDFLTMDVGMPEILAGMPWSCLAARKCRTRLARHFKEYLRLAWRDGDQILDGASTLMNRTVALAKDAITEDELARLLLALHWGTCSNLMNASFWLWAYLLTDGSAFLKIRDEINTAIADKFGDVESILRAGPSAFDDPCFATLNSAIRETLRMIVLPTSVRQAVKDATLVVEGGREYHIPKGNLVVLDVWNMHRDEEAWAEAYTFKVDRFIEKEKLRGKTMSKTKEFVPFGGGDHMCRGREFALQAIRTMVVVVISLFDISLIQEPGTVTKVPEFDLTEMGSTLRPLSDLRIVLAPIQN